MSEYLVARVGGEWRFEAGAEGIDLLAYKTLVLVVVQILRICRRAQQNQLAGYLVSRCLRFLRRASFHCDLKQLRILRHFNSHALFQCWPGLT